MHTIAAPAAVYFHKDIGDAHENYKVKIKMIEKNAKDLFISNLD